MTKELQLGLFGFGCVGQGLYGVLNETRGIEAPIAKIAVKNRDKQRPIGPENFTYHAPELLQNPELNVIVELIDTADEAFEIVRSALTNGKAVVTANKKMVAEHLEELVALQQEHNVPLLYEASCAGSIPIIRNLEEYYDNDLLSGLSGILNGTCNYILSRMFNEGVAYEDVLQEAQRLGFAESDPTLDVDGFDAKYKLVILTTHAFGVFQQPEAVLNVGIRGVRAADFQFAREKGYKLQLVATSVKVAENQIASFVLPQFVAADHLLYGVDREFNGIIVEAGFAEQQFFVGKGAGSYPTASAVLSDVSALRYNYRYQYNKVRQADNLAPTTDVPLRVYLRYTPGQAIADELPFQEIAVRHNSSNLNYVVGDILLSDLLQQADELRKGEVFLGLMPEQPGLQTPEPTTETLAAVAG